MKCARCKPFSYVNMSVKCTRASHTQISEESGRQYHCARSAKSMCRECDCKRKALVNMSPSIFWERYIILLDPGSTQVRYICLLFCNTAHNDVDRSAWRRRHWPRTQSSLGISAAHLSAGNTSFLVLLYSQPFFVRFLFCQQELHVLGVLLALDNGGHRPLRYLFRVHLLELVLFVVEDVRHRKDERIGETRDFLT